MNEPVIISEAALGYLKSTSPWVTFLAVMAFIGTAFMVLASLFMFAGSALGRADPRLPVVLFVLLGSVYIVASVFFLLIPGILLIRYSSAISRVAGSGQKALEDALARQKSFWEYAGIFTIVMLAIDVLMLIGVFGFGLFHGTMLRP
ncbi:MAG TPA: hypothetical protein VJR90_11840 [Gammaproteobacteria bacterium]|nr:hypothetical protein [Gammaproteobacteria bacterium]